MVFSHIEDFLEAKQKSNGLGFWCEQSFESCHHDFKVLWYWIIFQVYNFFFVQCEWDKVKVDSKHPDFGPRLKSAISAYNAKHI